MNRIARNLSIAFVLELLAMLAIADCLHGCTVDDVDDVDPDEDCGPEDLLCPCELPTDCSAYGLGGERGLCIDDRCTIECATDEDCAEREHATCGPNVLVLSDGSKRKLCTEAS